MKTVEEIRKALALNENVNVKYNRSNLMIQALPMVPGSMYDMHVSLDGKTNTISLDLELRNHNFKTPSEYHRWLAGKWNLILKNLEKNAKCEVTDGKYLSNRSIVTVPRAKVVYMVVSNEENVLDNLKEFVNLVNEIVYNVF